MKKQISQSLPKNLEAIEQATADSGFSMPSDRETGSLLKVLAASKPNGNFLELGTGTGLASAWILTGMNSNAILDSVDNDESVLSIARRHLDHDSRITFHLTDGDEFIKNANSGSYDFVFADAWPGKYNLLEETLNLLKIGGMYIIDDMMSQPNWPDGHDQKAAKLLDDLSSRPDFSICKMNWATGIVLCTRTD